MIVSPRHVPLAGALEYGEDVVDDEVDVAGERSEDVARDLREETDVDGSRNDGRMSVVSAV